MAVIRRKFSTHVNAKTLAAVRRLVKKEGQPLEALIEEALVDLLAKRRLDRPRAHVITAYQRSHAQYRELYKKLAQ